MCPAPEGGAHLIIKRKALQMADTENKDIDFDKAKGETKPAEDKKKEGAKPKKNHSKKSFAWWAGVIVLILISITFILPATGVSMLFTSSGLEFGRYNGQPISYENGSYMYNQFMSLYSQYGMYMSQETILQQAYYNTVLYEALTQKAEAVDLFVSEEMVNRGILDSGYYNNDQGVFDESIYQSTGVSERTSVYNSIQQSMPAQIVSTDISSVLSSQGERDFVSSMASTGRTFDYVAFDAASYPADRAVAYANSNPQPFTQITLSTLTATSEADAQALMDEITGDPAAFDSHMDAGEGISGTYCFHTIAELGEDVANEIFSTSVGSFAGPYLDGTVYEIYRVDAAPFMPDFTSEEMLAEIRTYIGANESALVSEYAQEAADVFYAVAQDDFDAALEQYGLSAQNVTFTPASTGSSLMLTSFSTSDSYGLLSTASLADSAYNDQLFSSAEGTVLAPQAAGDAYIVTRVNAETQDANQSSFVDSFYDYLVSTFSQNDLSSAILTSPLFEDNFLATLIGNLVQ